MVDAASKHDFAAQRIGVQRPATVPTGSNPGDTVCRPSGTDVNSTAAGPLLARCGAARTIATTRSGSRRRSDKNSRARASTARQLLATGAGLHRRALPTRAKQETARLLDDRVAFVGQTELPENPLGSHILRCRNPDQGS